MAFVSRINYGESTDTCQGTRLGPLILQKCPSILNQRMRDLFACFISPNWNALLIHLCLLIVCSFFEKGVPSSEKPSQPSKITLLFLLSEFHLESIHLLPGPRVWLLLDINRKWIFLESGGNVYVGFCPIELNYDTLPRTLTQNYLIFRSSTVDFLNCSQCGARVLVSCIGCWGW